MATVTTLFHRELGGAGRPPLVFLHGLLGSSRNWQTTGGAFSDRFEVTALDLRNHGRSFHADEMSYDAMVDDVVTWLDQRGYSSVSLVGHSMGGKVAMALAVRHPTRVERLVVVDIVPKDYHSNAHRAEFAAMNELDLRTLQSRGEAELKFEGRVPDWAMRKFLTTNLERDEATQAWKWLVNLPVLTSALEQLEANPLAEGAAYGGPVLFLSGGRSRYVQPGDVERARGVFARAESCVVADSGHNPHMETRERFVAEVSGFLAKT